MPHTPSLRGGEADAAIQRFLRFASSMRRKIVRGWNWFAAWAVPRRNDQRAGVLPPSRRDFQQARPQRATPVVAGMYTFHTACNPTLATVLRDCLRVHMGRKKPGTVAPRATLVAVVVQIAQRRDDAETLRSSGWRSGRSGRSQPGVNKAQRPEPSAAPAKF